MDRRVLTRRLTVGLVLYTCLTPLSAWATDGTAGAPGADDFDPFGPAVGGAGGAGGNATFPGNGGSGGVGGSGGSSQFDATGGSGGAGGLGANAASAGGTGGIGGAGGAGGAAETDGGRGTGGNGGTGGAGGLGSSGAAGAAGITGGPIIVNSATLIGGTGNTGGSGGRGGGGGRGGDGNGFGIAADAIGGSGGAGGIGGAGGAGGTGGAGIDASGATIINSGTIRGGQGGVGGQGGQGGQGGRGGDGTAGGAGIGGDGGQGWTGGAGGAGGTGGVAISGSNLTIINDGALIPGAGGNGGAGGSGVSGGVGGSGSTQGGIGGSVGAAGSPGSSGSVSSNAIVFTGGTNVLELRSGSSISGNVVAFSAADTLRLGGSTNATFDTSQIGAAARFRTFGVFEKTGTGTWTLTNAPGVATPWTISQGTLALANGASLGGGALTFNGGTLQALGTLTLTGAIAINAGGGTFDTNGNNVIVSSAISGAGGLTKNGAGELRMEAVSTYGGGTTVNAGTLVLDSVGGSLPVGGALTVNGGLFDMSGIATGQTVGALAGTGGQISLGANNLTTNSNANTTLATQITGTGALIKQGAGTLTLTGNNLYSGGTTISGGLINFSALNNFGTGPITLNGGGLQWAAGNTLDVSSRLVLGAGGAAFDTNSSNITLAGNLAGTGGLTKQGLGTLNLTGVNTYTGPTSVTAGTLAVNGSVTSNITVGAAGTLGGTGTIFGTVNTLGTLAPGNSIGTITVSGSFTQAAGSIYQVEVNAAGQGDRINVTGTPGTATINGGTVQVIAAPGTYGASTTYTILNATGGRTGTYAGVTSNFAFLTPSLSYDANNVFLTLALLTNGNPGSGGFLLSAYTPNQKAVGFALNQSFASATGDFATVISVLSGLTAFQGPGALTALSGEQYADFGTMNTNNAAMFMNAVGQQMAIARGSAASGQRTPLAQACDVAACDAISPFSMWGSALGGVGSVNGDSNASSATYNFGGAAVGIDYRLDPRFLVGLAASYTSGNLWVNGFPGKGWSSNVGVAAYGSFTQGGFYADLLGGYAYYGNQLQRQIQISGLQRMAWGSTGANQALGQAETGYRIGVYAPAAATLAPFARLQGSSVMQNGFTESGAQSLNLNVAQQTTNSLRTLFGLDLTGAVPLGTDRTLDLGLRLGWQHEFASTQRPITAALSGAPFAAFTVYGAAPQPDSAVVSFRANTRLAEQMQLYLRYDGDIGSGTDNHALNLGLRFSW